VISSEFRFQFKGFIMGLLDGVLGSVISGAMGGGAAKPDLMSSVIGGLLQQAGGVGGLLGMLKGAGMGQQADSWQSTGQNLPIDPADLMKVLGGGGAQAAGGAGGAMGGMGGLLGQVLSGAAPGAAGGGSIGDLLAKSGIGQDQLGGLLSQVLPQVVDGMTPNGKVEDHSDDMMQNVLGGLMSKMGGKGGLFG
jgi:uncharacterized protein YidB (DUF937 family)